MKDSIIIRNYVAGDEYDISKVVSETLRVSNSKDYTSDFLEKTIESHSPNYFAERAADSHFYVACDNGNIIGCGGITGYWGSETESFLLSIFVLPEYQGKGVGRRIIRTLEKDVFFTRAYRTEVASSVTSVGFYRRMGYEFKNGITARDEFQTVRLENIIPITDKKLSRRGDLTITPAGNVILRALFD